jgi:hypothetical protein
MSAISEFKDAAAWNSSQAAPPSEDSLAEVKELLREIRDLQRAHFQRYQEFTSTILSADKTRQQDLGQLQMEQMRYQEEMRQAAFIRQLISWAVWGAIVVACFVSMFLFQFLTPFD